MEVSSSQDAGSSCGDYSDTAPTDSALIKRAVEVREKLQDDTYSWIMQCLEMIFEYYNEKGPRDIEVAKLTEVALDFCLQQLENRRAQDIYQKLCYLYPVKSCSRELDYTVEYNKLKSKEPKVKKEDARKHPKFVKFSERVKELERGKELSQREAIAVD